LSALVEAADSSKLPAFIPGCPIIFRGSKIMSGHKNNRSVFDFYEKYEKGMKKYLLLNFT